jgi:hypothetical protein
MQWPCAARQVARCVPTSRGPYTIYMGEAVRVKTLTTPNVLVAVAGAGVPHPRSR